MSAAVLISGVPGRATDERTRIVRAVLGLLESLSRRRAGGYLEALDFYQGEIGDDSDVDQVKAALRGRTPAVLVSVGTATYVSKSTNGRSYLANYQLELAVVSNHWGSNEDRGIGGADKFVDDADPGINAILADVRGRLAGRRLNVDGCQRARPNSESPIYQGKDMVIFQARYQVGMAFKQPSHSDLAPNAAESVGVTSTLIVEPAE